MALCKLLRTEKGKYKVVDEENYIYTRNRENIDGSIIYWTCEKRPCRAKLHTDETFHVLKKVGKHEHAATAAEVSYKSAITKLKEKSISSCNNPRSIFSNVIGDLNENALSHAPTLPNICRNIRRWKSVVSNYPPTPSKRTEFTIPYKYSHFDNDSKFLQYDSGPNDEERILIFASGQALEHLKQYKTWAADGTFKCSPTVFLQLYVIHVQDGTFNAPRIFALLPNKKQSTYDKLFRTVKELIQNKGPENLIVDYEKAAFQSFLQHFPTCNVYGCLFHLGQNVYKHIVQHGFKMKYHEDDTFSLKMRCFVALAFLPLEDVTEGFEELTDDDEIPQEIVSYFENTYIGQVRGRGQQRRRLAPAFPIPMWNVSNRCETNISRTINSLEGFHSSLNGSLSKIHPNIWVLIENLKREEVLANAKCQQHFQGAEIHRKKKYRDLDKRLLNVISNYDSENKIAFLKAVAHSLKF